MNSAAEVVPGLVQYVKGVATFLENRLKEILTVAGRSEEEKYKKWSILAEIESDSGLNCYIRVSVRLVPARLSVMPDPYGGKDRNIGSSDSVSVGLYNAQFLLPNGPVYNALRPPPSPASALTSTSPRFLPLTESLLALIAWCKRAVVAHTGIA